MRSASSGSASATFAATAEPGKSQIGGILRIRTAAWRARGKLAVGERIDVVHPAPVEGERTVRKPPEAIAPLVAVEVAAADHDLARLRRMGTMVGHRVEFPLRLS